MSPQRPVVVAHRGASADVAEHTLASYQRAMALGVEGLECDVRLTRDGVLVCVHDRRVDRTSSGRGVVSSLELADLAELDFASWHDGLDAASPDDLIVERDDADVVGGRSSVLTLDRLIRSVRADGRPMTLAIETKHPTRYAGLVESTLAEVLADHGLDRLDGVGGVRVRVMSFSTLSLRRLRLLLPELPTVHLMRRVPLPCRDGSTFAGSPIAGPQLSALRAFPSYVRRAQEQGHQVHVWTVDEPEDVEFVVGLGVDGIITNRPEQVTRQLTALGATGP